ncbi:MAG TPA: hypothetical protein VGG34_08145 [Opitutaceae bacterium]|jgi:hypothetical protein
MAEPAAHRVPPHVNVHKLARIALFGFILTFIGARICVFMIMARKMPNLYFFMSGTHVHHLNYGIFLLAGVGGYAVFRRPCGRAAELAALVYGIAMALTFDEFGMWLHLGGSYWQRASIDMVVVVAAIIAFFAYVRSIERLGSRHRWAFALLALAVAGFAWALYSAGNRLGTLVGPRLEELEQASSP